MSVTFTAALIEIDPDSPSYVVTCGCPHATALAPRHTYAQAARIALAATNHPGRTPLPGCEWPDDCPWAAPMVISPEEDEMPMVDVSHDNGRMLLDALGLDDFAGQLAPADLLGRALTALALAPVDEGRPGVREGRFLDACRSAGWLQRRLIELHDLAEWCAGQGRAVHWY